MDGKLRIFVGPMFSGKTTSLIRSYMQARAEGKKVVAFKWIEDMRYSNSSIVSHVGETIDAIPTSHLLDCVKMTVGCDLVCIDEGQFFDDIVSFTKDLINRSIDVVISGLDADYQRKPIGSIFELLPLTSSFKKCVIGGRAFTKRLIESTDQIYIGGIDCYQPMTRAQYFNLQSAGSITTVIGDSGALKDFILNCGARKSCSSLQIIEPSEKVVVLKDAHKFEGVENWADDLANNGHFVYLGVSPESTRASSIVAISDFYIKP